jgi:hypothetical protein
LRAFAPDHLKRRIDERINIGRDLEKGLTAEERKYCLLVLAASEHAGQMTADERRAYHEARAAYRRRLARRKDSAA